MPKKILSYEDAVKNFRLVEGGRIKRIAAKKKVLIGQYADVNTPTGYRIVWLSRRSFMAHRVVWLLSYGAWPSSMLDHINGDRGDNRIENLRLSNNSENIQNLRRARVDNLTGYLGVNKHASGYRARIWVGGKNLSIGCSFKTPDEAHDAYVTAKRVLHAACTI
jgi:hypothetical protein